MYDNISYDSMCYVALLYRYFIVYDSVIRAVTAATALVLDMILLSYDSMIIKRDYIDRISHYSLLTLYITIEISLYVDTFNYSF